MVETYQKDRSCPDGDGPCSRDVAQVTALSWIVKAAADGQPDVLRVTLGGRTILNWASGLSRWTPTILPIRLLTRTRWRFQTYLADDFPDSPKVDREVPCDPNGPLYCGFTKPPDFERDLPPFLYWFWLNPGAHDVTVTAFRKEQDGDLTELCKKTRTYNVKDLNHDDPDRQAVDYYVQGGLFPSTTPAALDDVDPMLHIKWHTTRDKEKHFMGEDWLAFHRMLVQSFDDWRATFGYQPVTPYDGSTPVPIQDGGFSMIDDTRPETSGGQFNPPCYADGTVGCPPGPWLTVGGAGVHARGNDIHEGKCYYAPDRHGVVEEVPTGQRSLADFKDARGLGCVINKTHHGQMHQVNSGTFHFIATTPRDPLFWAYHKWASGFGPDYVPPVTTPPLFAPTSGRARAADPAADGVLTAWEKLKAAGPPGITAVFPPKGLAISQLPGIQVMFWEKVEGVQASDLTVNGSPATTVVGDGAEYVFSGFAVPPAPPAGGAVPLAVELAAGAIRDLQGTPFPGDGWPYELQHDQDGDAIPDDADNCLDVANPSQLNTDTLTAASFGSHDHSYGLGLGDVLGDVCDDDDDGDLIPDEIELATGSDPLDWRSPERCPLDPYKTEPGPCGCGVREVGSGDALICELGPACAAPAATADVHHHDGSRRAVPPGCDDGDACTTDTCVEPTGCAHTAQPGFEGFACRLEQLRRPVLCGDDVVNRKFARALARRVKAVLRVAQKAARQTKPAKRVKLLRRASRVLQTLDPMVGRALKRRQITTTCRTTLTGIINAARESTPQ